MASTDIYEVKKEPWEKEAKTPSSKRGRRHRSRPVKTFDEAVDKDLGATHRRRSRNSGLRRFRHLMKNPSFSKKFWIFTLGGSGMILLLLIVWDLFFRYPRNTYEREQDVPRAMKR